MPNADGQWKETQALTRAVPTTDKTLGVSLMNKRGWRVTISANAAQTLTGAGNLRCYSWDNEYLEWIRAPDFDIALTVAAGVRRCTFPDPQPAVKRGGVMYATDGVGVSGGTDVEVKVEAD